MVSKVFMVIVSSGHWSWVFILLLESWKIEWTGWVWKGIALCLGSNGYLA